MILPDLKKEEKVYIRRQYFVLSTTLSVLNIILEEVLKPGSEALIFQTLGDEPGNGIQSRARTDNTGWSLGS